MRPQERRCSPATAAFRGGHALLRTLEREAAASGCAFRSASTPKQAKLPFSSTFQREKRPKPPFSGLGLLSIQEQVSVRSSLDPGSEAGMTAWRDAGMTAYSEAGMTAGGWRRDDRRDQ
jgi:hypothetical protein